MGPLDALIHLGNLLLPALGLGLIASALTKLLWRTALRGVAWKRLVGWACGGALLALVGGLVFHGRDGRMSTYVAMVLATAAGLWWSGFGSGRR